MTTMLERPTAVRRPRSRPRPEVVTLVPQPRREPEEPRRARSWALSELMGRRPDLHDVYAPATVAADSILWSV